MKEFDVTEQTDVTDEMAYERGLTIKSLVALAVVAVIVLVRQRYLG
jgi:hypothetical protein